MGNGNGNGPDLDVICSKRSRFLPHSGNEKTLPFIQSERRILLFIF